MDKRGKKASDGVLPDCPGGGMPPVPLGNRTKMESTAALLPKQGSRAMGFGTDCEKRKGNRQKNKSLTHHKPPKSWWTHATFKDMDNRGFAVTVLVCVSNMHRGKEPFPPPVEIHILICATNWIPPPLKKKNPPLCTISWQCRLCAARAATGYQVASLGAEICVGGSGGVPLSPRAAAGTWLCNTNISCLSATHPYVGMSFPACKHWPDPLPLASYNIHGFTSTEDMVMENAATSPAYR